jgi:PAS domain S-box-containing protein
MSKKLLDEIEQLRIRLREAEETLDAIRTGSVDAVVVDGPNGLQVFTLRGANHPYRVLVESMNEGALTLSPDGTIIYSNKKFSELMATPLERVLGGSILRFVAPQNLEKLAAMVEDRFEDDSKGEFTLITGQGGSVPVHISGHTLEIADVESVCAVVTDLTDRKRAEESLRRVNRALKTLSEFNQMLVRLDTEAALLNETCRLIVEIGGYRMAWIGFARHDKAKTVEPVALAGHEEGYLKAVKITWSNEETVGCPTGTAIRTGIVTINKNGSNNPNYGPWRSEAVQRGYAAAIAIPLVEQNGVFGALSVYAEDPDAFDDDEVKLLTQLADDLSFGIRALKMRAEKEKADAALRASEERFKAVIEGARDYIYIKDRSLRYTHVNPAVEKLLDLPSSKIIGRTFQDVFGNDGADEVKDLEIRVLEGESIEDEHARIVHGVSITFLNSRIPLRDADGNVIGIFVISRDITGRKQPRLPAPAAVYIYPSKAMKSALEMASLAAKQESTVLLLGESGSGKDYVAKYIHEHSGREGGPYFSINCAAITAELAESELFGHERGSFTGAHARKRGLLELAEGGTILLNEIGDLSLALQSKLLTFLDTRKFTRVGGEKEISVSARLIAATNKDLTKEVEAGRFRGDLYYRLSVMTIKIPPLRERKEDISVLVQQLLSRLAADLHLHKIPKVSASDMGALKRYNWPGNVRELRNVLERSLLLSPGDELDLTEVGIPVDRNLTGDSKDEKSSYSVSFPPDQSLNEITQELKRFLVNEALRKSGGSRQGAARILGISRYSLKHYMKTLGYDEEE